MSTTHATARAVLAVLDLLLVAGVLTWYLRAARALPDGRVWSRPRSISFTVGMLGFGAASLVLTDGPARSTFWIWLTLMLAVLLIVPLPIMWGHPLQLAEQTARAQLLRRFVDSGFIRAVHNPMVAAAIIPVVCAAAFFGPVPGWAVGSPVAGWVTQLVLLTLGCLVALPLTTDDSRTSSLAVGAAVLISLFELLLDAIPGIVMRLSTHPVNTYFDHSAAARFGLTPIRDQQIGGAILWAVAELLDLPFLVLIYFRWARTDAREAAELDRSLDEQQIERDFRTEVSQLTGEDASDAPSDQPWFLTDPRLRDRFR